MLTSCNRKTGNIFTRPEFSEGVSAAHKKPCPYVVLQAWKTLVIVGTLGSQLRLFLSHRKYMVLNCIGSRGEANVQ